MLTTTQTETYKLVPRNQLLSGDVVAKLAAYRSLAEVDPSYLPEVDALEDVQPERIAIEDIEIELGATWIPLPYYEAFCRDVLRVPTRFFYNERVNSWHVDVGQFCTLENRQYGCSFNGWKKNSKGDWEEETLEYLGIHEKPEFSLLTMALNFKSPVVRRSPEPGNDKAQDDAATIEVVAKQEDLKLAFQRWILDDSNRSENLENLYNERFNRLLLPEWDGTGAHLREVLAQTGADPGWVARLRPYQLDVIWRGIVDPNWLVVGLEVGLGKSAVAVVLTMLRRWYGMTKKAIAVVQNSTLEQFVEAAREIYPNARILAQTPEMTKGKSAIESANLRQGLLANIAYNEWDLVILGHSAFDAMPLKAETEIGFVREWLEAVEQDISFLEDSGESSKNRKGRKGNRILKKLESLKARLDEELKKLWMRKLLDAGMTLEDLGVDLLIVDEIQRYKNAIVTTKIDDIAGLATGDSDRAKNFEMVLGYLRRSGAKVVGMTGTPEPTNSITGIFSFLRFFVPDGLVQRQMTQFDSFVSLHAKVNVEPEVKVSGNLAMTARFTEFVNLPELMKLYFSFAHVRRYEQVKEQVKGLRPEPKHKHVSCPMSDWQLAYMKDIEERYWAVRKRVPRQFIARNQDGFLLDKNKKKVLLHPETGRPLESVEEATNLGLQFGVICDSFFKISSEARMCCLCPQLLKPEMAVDEGSKIARACKRIYRLWRLGERNGERWTQLVFLDVGTPGGSAKFPMYQWMKQRLIELGVPQEQVAFVHDAKKPEQRRELFDRFNNGEVRVLIGSTEKMGIGVNVQKRVIAAHLIDLPWRPDQYEQRMGRYIRSGNKYQKVLSYQYLTAGRKGNYGIDSFQLQLLQVKIAMRERLLSGDFSIRRIAEENKQQELFLMLKAHATGDSAAIEFIKVQGERKKLEARLRSNRRDVQQARKGSKDGVAYYQGRIRKLEAALAHPNPDLELYHKLRDRCASDDWFRITLGKEEYVGSSLPGVTVYRSDGKECDVKRAKRLADAHLQNVVEMEIAKVETGTIKPWNHAKVGEFGGLDVKLMVVENARSKLSAELWLEGFYIPHNSAATKRYKFDFARSEQRLIRNLVRAYDSIPDTRRELEYELKSVRELLQKRERQLERLEALTPELEAQLKEIKQRELALQLRLGVEAGA